MMSVTDSESVIRDGELVRNSLLLSANAIRSPDFKEQLVNRNINNFIATNSVNVNDFPDYLYIDSDIAYYVIDSVGKSKFEDSGVYDEFKRSLSYYKKDARKIAKQFSNRNKYKLLGTVLSNISNLQFLDNSEDLRERLMAKNLAIVPRELVLYKLFVGLILKTNRHFTQQLNVNPIQLEKNVVMNSDVGGVWLEDSIRNIPLSIKDLEFEAGKSEDGLVFRDTSSSLYLLSENAIEAIRIRLNSVQEKSRKIEDDFGLGALDMNSSKNVYLNNIQNKIKIGFPEIRRPLTMLDARNRFCSILSDQRSTNILVKDAAENVNRAFDIVIPTDKKALLSIVEGIPLYEYYCYILDILMDFDHDKITSTDLLREIEIDTSKKYSSAIPLFDKITVGYTAVSNFRNKRFMFAHTLAHEIAHLWMEHYSNKANELVYEKFGWKKYEIFDYSLSGEVRKVELNKTVYDSWLADLYGDRVVDTNEHQEFSKLMTIISLGFGNTRFKHGYPKEIDDSEMPKLSDSYVEKWFYDFLKEPYFTSNPIDKKFCETHSSEFLTELKINVGVGNANAHSVKFSFYKNLKSRLCCARCNSYWEERVEGLLNVDGLAFITQFHYRYLVSFNLARHNAIRLKTLRTFSYFSPDEFFAELVADYYIKYKYSERGRISNGVLSKIRIPVFAKDHLEGMFN